jgi:DNA-binding IclR family transcriptional regulator
MIWVSYCLGLHADYRDTMAKLIFAIRKKKQKSQTLLRGLQLLEVIPKNSNLSIRELADKVNLPRSIVHRLMATLESEKYIQKNSAQPGYRLGIKLWSLGCVAVQGTEMKEIARAQLEDLACKTNELVVLAVIDGREVVYLDKIDCPQAVRAYLPVGGRAPAYCISTGKAILAYRPDDVIMHITSAKKFDSKTPGGPEAFKLHLAQIRRRGYAINLGQWRGEVGGVASAIRDSEGNAVAAIGVTVPLHRLTKENIGRLGRLVMKAAATVSDTLGYEGPQKRRSTA